MTLLNLIIPFISSALGNFISKHENLLAELVLLDKALSGILFHDPQHTISYNIAIAARAGNPLAKELCLALNVLSPNHCENAIKNETPAPSAA